MKFSGKRILVTGAGSGLGRHVALRLADMGAEVFAISRTQANLDSLKEENPTITVKSVDIGNWNATRKAIREFFPLHCVVNNAAQLICNLAMNIKEEDFDIMFGVNVKGLYNVMQVAAEDMIARKNGGNIVNVSSVDSYRPYKDFLVYGATKAGVDFLTKGFAAELGPKGIKVNAVNPTLIETAGMAVGFSESQENIDELLARTPRGRVASMDDVTNAIVFLLSDESDIITGHCLAIDGGYLAM